MTTYAVDTYTGDGSKVDFGVSFGFLQRDHVTATRIDVSTGVETALKVVTVGAPTGDQYAWVTDSVIQVGTAPTAQQELKIERDTPEGDQIVQWADGSYIVAEDLNTSDKQWLYGLQELEDQITTLAGSGGTAVTGVSSGGAPVVVDSTDKQKPVISVVETQSTDDPNALTSDTTLMSEKAIDSAFKQHIGSGPSSVNKVGQLRIDNSSTPQKTYWWNGNAWVELGTKGDQGNPGPPPGLQDPSATVTSIPLKPGNVVGDPVAVVSQDSGGDLQFQFGIPVGQKGDRGPQGPEGPPGDGVDYKGTVDATTAPEPSEKENGDFYLNTVAGTSSWTGLSAVQVNTRIIWNERAGKWDAFNPTTSVNLGYTAAADKGTITNNAGTDAEIPIVNSTNAGLLSPSQLTTLNTKPTLQSVLDEGNTSTTDLWIGTGGQNVELKNNGSVVTTGSIGIGTTPEYKLDVNDNRIRVGPTGSGSAVVQYGRGNTASQNWHAGSTGTGNFNFWNGNYGSGSLAMSLTSEGNVGVGNDNPFDYDSTANDLVVGAAGAGDRGITIASGGASRGTLMFADDTTGLGEYAGYVQYKHDLNAMFFATNNDVAACITSEGFLGVGTENPARNLHIKSDLNNPVRIQSTATYSRIEFESAASTNGPNVSIGASGDDFRVFTGTNGNIATRMVVTDEGAVGITEENPQSNLHITTGLNWNYPEIFLQRDGSNIPNHNYMIAFGLGADTATNADPAKAAYIGLHTNSAPTAGDTLFGQNAKIEMSSPGGIYFPRNVAIGRADADPFYKLDVEGYLRVSDGTAGLGLIQLGDASNPYDNFHIGSNSAGAFEIWNRNIGSGISMMSIDSNANMLVQGNLTVNGTINGGSPGGSGGAYKNVKTQFGAVGDGNTDDTVAIRSALNSGGGIYFPAGTYRVTDTLTCTKAFKIVGDGQQSRIMYDKNVNNTDFFFLQLDERHQNDLKWSFTDVAITCKAVAGRVHSTGIRLKYNGPATVIGGTNYLELTNVHIVSEITTDATQSYFAIGLQTNECGGVVANNLNISTFSNIAEDNSITQGIRILNFLPNHAVIRAFTGTNIYIQKYYRGVYVSKSGGGQNIESVYMTNGEIVCYKGIEFDAGHATFINGMHIECKADAYINNSDGGPHRIVGCDLRGGRNGTEGLTDYSVKLNANWTTMAACVLLAQMPSKGIIRVGQSGKSPLGVVMTGNFFSGNNDSNYHALKVDAGAKEVTFGGNQFRDFGSNINPVANDAGVELTVYGQRSGNTPASSTADVEDLLERIQALETNQAAQMPVNIPRRARNADGTFRADDPSTPDVNEAWEGGEPPAN